MEDASPKHFGRTQNELKQAGFDDIIRKPVSPEIVLQKIAECLSVGYICDRVTPTINTYGAMDYLNSDNSDTSLIEELMTMPSTWLSQIHQAANEVNEDLLQHLIEEIPQDKQALSQPLSELIKNFRLDIIIQLTTKIIN